MNYKLVVIVRSDLGISPGKMAAQVAHASVNCALLSKKNAPRSFRAWYDEGQKKVVLKAKSLKELYELKERAKREGLVTSLVMDAGLTELPPSTVTCLGIGPDRDSIVDKVTGSLPLL